MSFVLDPMLEETTRLVKLLDLCDLRLTNDARWPWFLLVPRIEGAVEWPDLDRETRNGIDAEMVTVARAVKEITQCEKLNLATIGNVVPQMHLHVVARNSGDPNWPNPVWGYGSREPYSEEAIEALIEKINQKL